MGPSLALWRDYKEMNYEEALRGSARRIWPAREGCKLQKEKLGCLSLPGRGGDEGPRAPAHQFFWVILLRLHPAPLPSAALHSHRPADHDCGAGGLWQVFAPPRHPGGDAEGVGGCLLEQVLLAPLPPATSLWRMPPHGWALRKCSSFPHGVFTLASQPLLCHVPGFCTSLCTNDFLESL